MTINKLSPASCTRIQRRPNKAIPCYPTFLGLMLFLFGYEIISKTKKVFSHDLSRISWIIHEIWLAAFGKVAKITYARRKKTDILRSVSVPPLGSAFCDFFGVLLTYIMIKCVLKQILHNEKSIFI